MSFKEELRRKKLPSPFIFLGKKIDFLLNRVEIDVILMKIYLYIYLKQKNVFLLFIKQCLTSDEIYNKMVFSSNPLTLIFDVKTSKIFCILKSNKSLVLRKTFLQNG